MSAARELSTTAADKRMIDAWATRHLRSQDVSTDGTADRASEALALVHRALDLEGLLGQAPRTGVEPLRAPTKR